MPVLRINRTELLEVAVQCTMYSVEKVLLVSATTNAVNNGSVCSVLRGKMSYR